MKYCRFLMGLIIFTYDGWHCGGYVFWRGIQTLLVKMLPVTTSPLARDLQRIQIIQQLTPTYRRSVRIILRLLCLLVP